MKLTITTAKERVYIPKFNGNRKQAETEQVKVTYKAPTSAIKESLMATRMTMIPDEAGKMQPNMSINIGKKSVLDMLVVKIDNYSYCVKEDPTKEVEIASSEDLFGAPLETKAGDLIEELYKMFMDLLNGKGVNEKN
jgi:hypothetical protein